MVDPSDERDLAGVFVARKSGDKHTAAVARQNRDEAEAMARNTRAKWHKIVELSLEGEGVRTP